MDELLRRFDSPVTDKSGATYTVSLYGRGREADTWQGWLVFERDGERLDTGVETTQPNAEAIVYWAGGLTDAYLDGALDRARRGPPGRPDPVPAPLPVIGQAADSATRQSRLAELESAILDCFKTSGMNRLLTSALFDLLPNANADIVRAIEDLEKQGGLLVRRTEEGNDWLVLTDAGVEVTGITGLKTHTATRRQPPKSAR